MQGARGRGLWRGALRGSGLGRRRGLWWGRGAVLALCAPRCSGWGRAVGALGGCAWVFAVGCAAGARARGMLQGMRRVARWGSGAGAPAVRAGVARCSRCTRHGARGEGVAQSSQWGVLRGSRRGVPLAPAMGPGPAGPWRGRGRGSSRLCASGGVRMVRSSRNGRRGMRGRMDDGSSGREKVAEMQRGTSAPIPRSTAVRFTSAQFPLFC